MTRVADSCVPLKQLKIQIMRLSIDSRFVSNILSRGSTMNEEKPMNTSKDSQGKCVCFMLLCLKSISNSNTARLYCNCSDFVSFFHLSVALLFSS